MNINVETRKKITKWIIGIATVCILIYLGVKNIAVVGGTVAWLVNLFFPLILGFGFAMILNVPMSFFESHLFSKPQKPILHNIRRPLAFVFSLLLIIGILTGVVWLVIPELINAIKIIAENVINMIREFSKMRAKNAHVHTPFYGVIDNIDWDNIRNTLENFIKTQGSSIMNTAVNTISSFVGGIVNFFFAVIFSIYILFGKETLKRQCRRIIKAWIPEKLGEWFVHSASVASKTFHNFVSGQTLEAFILGMLCLIGMLILQIPYAPMISALIGVMAFIPVVGAFIGVIIGTFMIITVSPIKAIIFVVFFLVLQQFEGNVIYPRVMGSKINLPAIWILAAVTVGGALAGALGMLLCVPITSTVYVLIREATEKREEKLNSEDIEKVLTDFNVENTDKNEQ